MTLPETENFVPINRRTLTVAEALQACDIADFVDIALGPISPEAQAMADRLILKDILAASIKRNRTVFEPDDENSIG